MLIPISVDAVFERRPVVNWVVLGVLVIVFGLQMLTAEKQVKKAPRIAEDLDKLELDKKKLVQEQFTTTPAVTGPMSRLVLKKWRPLGLVGYIWLHPNVTRFLGYVRFLGNLLFLWVFGNAVCSKIGGKIYLPVYLGLGLVTGVIHALFSSREAVGACGALNGIVGMYIVFFPENAMNCYALLPRPMPASLSGMWMVLIWFIFDIFETAMSGQNVVYWSHTGGLVIGAGLAVLMLEKKWVLMEKGERSLLQMFEKQQDLAEPAKEEKKEGRQELIEEKQVSKSAAGRLALEEEKKKKEQKDLEAMERLLGKRLQKTGAPVATTGAKSAFNETSPSGGPEKPPSTIPPAMVKTEVKNAQNDFIHFQCTCGHKVKIPRKFAGMTGKCKKCGKSIQIPGI